MVLCLRLAYSRPVRLFVLSRNETLYSTQRIVEAAEKRGHDVFVRDPLKFTLQVPGHPSLLYISKAFIMPQAVVPRIGASITHFGLTVVRQFEHSGVFALNTSSSIECSRDKLRALQVLAMNEVMVPRTAFVHRKQDLIKAIEDIGGAPVVIKLIEGTQGTGVVLAEDLNSAQALMELLQFARQRVIVQKFVKESRGTDVRAFVINNQVVAAMRRTATNPSEFRSNLHRGGKTESIVLPEAYEQAALKAASCLGLSVAGVDLLETADGPLVLEVNSSPGLEGIEQASGVDIADLMIQYVEDQVDS